MGAISLINLVGELDVVTLQSKFFGWVDAYSAFVERVFGWLFGWTENLGELLGITWIGISSGESHLLMLAILFFSAICRVIVKDEPNRAVTRTFFTALLVIVPPVTLSLLLPGKSGLITAATWFSLTVLFYLGLTLQMEKKASLTDRGESGAEPNPQLIWHELVGVFAVFLLLIALNYALAGD
jgi:hypothetical protein